MCGYCVYVKIKISQGFHNETVPVLDWIVRLLANTKWSGDRHWATFFLQPVPEFIILSFLNLSEKFNTIIYPMPILQCISNALLWLWNVFRWSPTSRQKTQLTIFNCHIYFSLGCMYFSWCIGYTISIKFQSPQLNWP